MNISQIKLDVSAVTEDDLGFVRLTVNTNIPISSVNLTDLLCTDVENVFKPKPKYIGLMQTFNSKTDTNGNREWAFEYTDFQTGKFVRCRITGGRGTTELAARGITGANDYGANIMHIGTELPIREFNSMVKTWASLGACSIAEYINRNIAPIALENV